MSRSFGAFTDDLTKANRGSDNSKTGWIAAGLMAVLLIGVFGALGLGPGQAPQA